MHRDDRARSWSDRALQSNHVHVVVRTYVDQFRSCTSVDNCRNGRGKCVGNGNDLVARPQTGSQHRKGERVITAVQSNRVLGADEASEVLLKCLELPAHDQVALGQTLSDCPVDTLSIATVVLPRIDKRNAVSQLSSRSEKSVPQSRRRHHLSIASVISS